MRGARGTLRVTRRDDEAADAAPLPFGADPYR